MSSKFEIFARALKRPRDDDEDNSPSNDPFDVIAELIDGLETRVNELEEKIRILDAANAKLVLESKPEPEPKSDQVSNSHSPTRRRRVEHIRNPLNHQIESSIIIDEDIS